MSHCRPGPDDLGIVVLNSGINAVPVELAEALAEPLVAGEQVWPDEVVDLLPGRNEGPEIA